MAFEVMEKEEVKSLKRTARYRSAKENLSDELKRNGVLGKTYSDLIEDYMDFWITKQLLVKDIMERGTLIKYNNGGGQTGWKKNDSIEQLVKVNTQMLKLLDALGLSPPVDVQGDDDELL